MSILNFLKEYNKKIKIIVFIIFTISAGFSYYNREEPIKVKYTDIFSMNNIKTIEYGDTTTIYSGLINGETVYSIYKKDITQNGNILYFDGEIVLGIIDNKKIAVLTDENRFVIFEFKSKKRLEKAITSLTNKDILWLSDKQMKQIDFIYHR